MWLAWFFFLAGVTVWLVEWRRAGRQPAHWPGRPAAFWAAETNWSSPLWPMRPLVLNQAAVYPMGTNSAWELYNHGRVALGRWTEPKVGWAWSMWVLPEPAWAKATGKLTLARAREPEYEVELVWEDGLIGVHHHWLSEAARLAGKSASQVFSQAHRPAALTHWLHLVIQGDSQWVQFYVDGVEVGRNSAVDSQLLRNAELELGPFNFLLNNSFIRAFFDDVAVFGRTLGPEEIKALAAVAPGGLPDVVAGPERAAALWRTGWPWAVGGLVVLVLVSNSGALRRASSVLLASLPQPAYRPVWLLLGTEVVLTLALAWGVARQAEREDAVRFEREVRRFADDIRDNFLRIADLVNAARDWVATQPEVTPAKWERWVASRSAEHDFPGLLGLGYAQKVLPAELAEAEVDWSRRYGFPFHVWPADEAALKGRPPRLLGEPRLPVVLYQPWHLAAPAWRSNGTILGCDLLAPRPGDLSVKPQPERIEDAIGSGSIMSSGLQEIAPAAWYGEPIRGLRLYSPQATAAPGDRQSLPAEIWSGVAFASVDVKRWLMERLGTSPPQLGFRIFTGEANENRHELAFDGGQLHPDAGARPDAAHSATREVRVFYFRLWLDCWSSPAFEAQSLRRWPGVILGAGGGFALLTAGLLFVQVRGRERETAGAEQLRAANAELARLDHEREHLSRDLHDGTIQNLYAVGLHLRHAQRHLPGTTGKTGQGLEEGQRLVQETIVELREFLLSLKDERIDGQTFAQTIEELFLRLRRTTQVEFELAVAPAAAELPSRVVVQLVNLVREAVSNALRHGSPRCVRVSLAPVAAAPVAADVSRWQSGTKGSKASGHGLTSAATGAGWSLEVRDDGTGFDPAAVNGGGFGLRTMRERAAELGGTLTVRSAPGAGTTVTAEFATEPPGEGAKP